jgi:UDP-4-amino-4,6-dideoxy-N-acetyl-beta-L-altrosamine transaminase
VTKIEPDRPLPYGRHLIEDDDVAAVVAALRSDWLTTGPAVRAFEDALASRVGAAHAVSCSSGTAALHLAALALGLGPGDRAVVPAITFVATANVIRHTGADVLFADCDPETGLMTADGFEAALEQAGHLGGPPVRAVLPVHFAGQCTDLDAIWEIAGRQDIAVVHDAAHAIGTGYQIGSERFSAGGLRHATMAAFSFHPVKTIAMGEGGAVTTDDPMLAQRLVRLRNHGLNRDPEAFENPSLAFDSVGRANPWYYELAEPGLNYRASDLHCALGVSQLAKLDRMVARRAALVARYDRHLARFAPRIRPLGRIPGCVPAWHLYVALVDFDAAGVDRARVMAGMAEAGITTMVHYLPVHMQPYYRGLYGAQDLPGALAYYRQALSLPLFPAMADADVDRVTGTLARALGLD